MTSSCGRAIVLVLPTSDWLRKWCEFSRIKKKRGEAKKTNNNNAFLKSGFPLSVGNQNQGDHYS